MLSIYLHESKDGGFQPSGLGHMPYLSHGGCQSNEVLYHVPYPTYGRGQPHKRLIHVPILS